MSEKEEFIAKKIILPGMGSEKGQLRGLTWGMVLLLSLLINSLNARAEMCIAGIDYNQPTIAAGWVHTLGIKEDGTVVAAGRAGSSWDYGQLNVASWTNIKAIATGGVPPWGTSFTIGLKEDGTVAAVGSNMWGELNVSGWTNIKAIAAGYGHTVGLKEDGTVVAVGANWGQLNVSSWTNIKAIAAGNGYTVGVKEDGTVLTTAGGPNVSEWTNIKAIAARHSLTVGLVGLKEDGTVVAVGNNDYGQLNVSGWINIKAIAVGGWHTVGLKEDGTVVAVGYGFFGQLSVWHWNNIRRPACLNNPPVASAGFDQVIECIGPSASTVTLNGTGSSDLDGDPLTYTWTWNGGSAEGVNPTVSLPLGTTIVTLTVSDGQATAIDTVNITVQDTISPVTTATGGSENWYNANVISTFSATDSCSGVKEIHYIVNGAETVIPGDSASLMLTTDGTYNIAYYSIDNAGNAESPNSMTVKIDKTPPVLNLSTNTNILWPPNHKMADVFIGGNATDSTSGIASVAFSVTDEYGTVQPSISNFNSTIQLEVWRNGTDKDGRRYTINAVAADAAGNRTTTSTTVLVPHDQGNY